MKTMPEKNPDFWAALYLFISTPLWQGAIMATTVSLLRVLYEAKEANKWRIVLEASSPPPTGESSAQDQSMDARLGYKNRRDNGADRLDRGIDQCCAGGDWLGCDLQC